MKLFFLAFFSCLIKVAAYGQKARPDTTFIFRQAGDYYHAIFIDDKNSDYYNKIVDHPYNDVDSLSFKENMIQLKKRYSGSFPRYNLENIHKKWVPIYLYKGNYFVYAPSEWGFNTWVEINDSFFIKYSFDDAAVPAIIQSLKKKNNKVTIDVVKPTLEKSTVKITIIDKKNQIAVFEYSDLTHPYRYRLMVSADNVRNFPIIVNYCEVQKQKELQFDTVNYNKLLKIKN